MFLVRLCLMPSNVSVTLAMKVTILEEEENALSPHPGDPQEASTPYKKSLVEPASHRYAELQKRKLAYKPQKAHQMKISWCYCRSFSRLRSSSQWNERIITKTTRAVAQRSWFQNSQSVMVWSPLWSWFSTALRLRRTQR